MTTRPRTRAAAFDFKVNYMHPPHPLYSPGFALCDFLLFIKIKLKIGGDVLRTLTKSRSNRSTWLRFWINMTTDHGKPSGIALSAQKEMEENENFDKWLRLGRRISGTFW
jgi:hypothetical protein